MVDDSQPFSQPATFTASPQLDWYLIDTDFAGMLHPVHEALVTETVHAKEAAEIFSTLLGSHFVQYGAFKLPKQPHLAPNTGSHRQEL